MQDEGSQVAAELAGAEPGMQVLDYCAGAGGKTLALSASMENRGQIFAYDFEKARLAPIFDRIRRSDNRNIQVVARLPELSALENQMDLVLIDAPCTGSGTWRRRPDAKWRLTQKQLDVRIAEQAAILDAAKAFVKPGGKIAYITCSVFQPRIPARSRHSWRATKISSRSITALWDASFPGKAGKARIDGGRGVSLSPAGSGTDGFYFAALSRKT